MKDITVKECILSSGIEAKLSISRYPVDRGGNISQQENVWWSNAGCICTYTQSEQLLQEEGSLLSSQM